MRFSSFRTLSRTVPRSTRVKRCTLINLLPKVHAHDICASVVRAANMLLSQHGHGPMVPGRRLGRWQSSSARNSACAANRILWSAQPSSLQCRQRFRKLNAACSLRCKCMYSGGISRSMWTSYDAACLHQAQRQGIGVLTFNAYALLYEEQACWWTGSLDTLIWVSRRKAMVITGRRWNVLTLVNLPSRDLSRDGGRDQLSSTRHEGNLARSRYIKHRRFTYDGPCPDPEHEDVPLTSPRVYSSHTILSYRCHDMCTIGIPEASR
jgi:hypothetical protein